MELTSVLVLMIIVSVAAGPYGYGTKGGAADKADARAVAGTYTGAGGLPLSIPSGASYSGSFSKSSSSSSSSSSASSSSFSYSGSGAIGAVLPSGSGCGSGNCITGGTAGTLVSPGTGAQAYSGASAGSFVGTFGNKIPIASYGHKYGLGAQTNGGQDCESGSCQGTSDLSSSNGNGAGIGSQSNNDAKSAATSGVGQTKKSDCGGSGCDNIPADKCVTGQCGSEAKCSSGSCGVASLTEGSSPQYGFNKCTSGQCRPNEDTDGSTTIDNETNDINVNTSGPKNSKTSHDANTPGCSNGKCGVTLSPGSPGYNIPSLDLTVPKLESPCSGSSCPITTPGYNSFGQTKPPYFSSIIQNGNHGGHMSPGYGGLSKPSYAYGSSPYSSIKPPGGAGCMPGTPGCAINAASSGPSDCSSGSCGTNPSVPDYDDLSSSKNNYSHGTTSLVNPSSSGCTLGTPGCKQSSSSHNPSICTFGNCGNSAPSGTKPSYTYESSPSLSNVYPSGSACAPGIADCSVAPPISGPSGYGSSLGVKPNYSHVSSSSYSSVKPSGLVCNPGSPNCAIPALPSGPSGDLKKPSDSHSGSLSHSKPSGPGCSPGNPGCDESSISTDSSGCASGDCSLNPTAAVYDIPSQIKPNYSHGTSHYNPVKPIGSCAPGTPGCNAVPSTIGPSDCKSGNCGSHPSYSGYSSIKPNYSQGSSPSYNSVKPVGLCTPGTLGCTATPSTSLGCISGNCGTYPSKPEMTGPFSIKPNYSYGSSTSYSSVKPVEPCTPGTPGCNAGPSASGPSDCKSGNCESFPSAPGYSGPSSIKPSNSQESSPSYHSMKPVGSCIPGTFGCIATQSTSLGCTSGKCGTYPSVPEIDKPSSIKPNYSYGSSIYQTSVKPVEPCTPGTPGCNAVQSSSGPSGCISGNCGAYPVAPGYGEPSRTKPNYSYTSTSYSSVKPIKPCMPGTSGCNVAPSASRPSDYISGNCGSLPSAPVYGSFSNKPNYSQGGIPSFSPLIPLSPPCAPGSPSCGRTASDATGCITGNCAYPSSAGVGSLNIKPSNSDSFPAQAQPKPAGQACGPGTPGCLLPSGSLSCTSGNCDEFPPIGGQGSVPSNSIKPSYSQGSSSYFPVKHLKPSCPPGASGCAVTSSISSSGCVSGNCDTNLSTQECAPGTPGCSGSTSGMQLGASGSVGASVPVVLTYSTTLPSGQASPASSVGSISHQASYGNHGSGPLQTFFNKPSTGMIGSGAYTPPFLSVPSTSNSPPGILESSPQLASTAGSHGQQAEKENISPYSGGFGGPPGILKPNEYSVAPTANIGNKASVTTATAIKTSSCGSGNCDTHGFPSGTASGAHSTVGASASANAVAYTGGFGGPPGLLKPYEDGKAIIKGASGTGPSLDLHKGIGGSGHLNGGSGSAIAQAAGVNAAGFATNVGYSHGNDVPSGCGNGCGSSASGGLAYSGSLGPSKTGVLDDSSYALASAGALAKSAANASSGARASGNNYASSSASAFAGASVKGGYGRR